MSNKTPKIYVAGHRGMVGSAILRELKNQGQHNVVVRTHAELDLTNQQAVQAFFEAEKPDQVYLAAAKIGGIHAKNFIKNKRLIYWLNYQRIKFFLKSSEIKITSLPQF